MRYISTRGDAPPLDFVEVMLAGLARDGGLYVPETWPQLDAATIASFAGRPYAETACAVMRPFIGGGYSGALGSEKALGTGAVGIENFIRALREIGFKGSLNVEREAEDPAERLRDMQTGVDLIRQLVPSS